MTTEKQSGSEAGRARPLSPCRMLCTLDDNRVCLGCRRTLAEISQWSLMTADEQWQVIVDLAAREAANNATILSLEGD